MTVASRQRAAAGAGRAGTGPVADAVRIEDYALIGDRTPRRWWPRRLDRLVLPAALRRRRRFAALVGTPSTAAGA